MVAAQLTQGARAMYGLVGAVIGIAYALRAIGDVGANGLSWLSPIGWYQAMHAYSGEQWWPTLLLLALTAVALGAAYALFQRRDLGAGILPDRPGAERASPGLLRPPGLTWRLQRWSILGWGAGLLLGGLAYGSIGDDVESLMGDSDFSRKVFTAGGGGSLVDGFYGAAAVMLALIASGFAVSSALRAHAEEDSGRLEPLLAAGSSRTRWLTQQAMVTLIGTVLMLALAGLGLGVGYTLVTGHGRVIGRFAEAALAQLPGVLVLVGLTFLLYGVGGRLARLSWLALGFCAVVMFFGPLLRFPDWLTTLSPFEHLAAYPAKAVDWTPFLSLVGLSIVLTALGLVAFQRRDVQLARFGARSVEQRSIWGNWRSTARRWGATAGWRYLPASAPSPRATWASAHSAREITEYTAVTRAAVSTAAGSSSDRTCSAPSRNCSSSTSSPPGRRARSSRRRCRRDRRRRTASRRPRRPRRGACHEVARHRVAVEPALGAFVEASQPVPAPLPEVVGHVGQGGAGERGPATAPGGHVEPVGQEATGSPVRSVVLPCREASECPGDEQPRWRLTEDLLGPHGDALVVLLDLTERRRHQAWPVDELRGAPPPPPRAASSRRGRVAAARGCRRPDAGAVSPPRSGRRRWRSTAHCCPGR